MSSLHVIAAEEQGPLPVDGGLAPPSWLPRAAALIGFAGALVLQGALFCLVARGLGADPAALPSLSTIAWLAALGGAMVGCRPLAEMRWRAAAEPGIARTGDAT